MSPFKQTNDRMIAGFFEGTGMPDPGWWKALFPQPAKILAAAGMKPGIEAAADLCSGNGWFTLQIAQAAHRVFAIDIDSSLLEVARKRLNENGIANCKFVEGDAYDIAKLCPCPVDFVFMANAFHGVPDRPRLSRQVYMALKPGGTFAIVNWHARPREQTLVLGEPRGPRTELRLSPERTAKDVEAGGFKLERTVEMPPHHYGMTFRR